MRAAKRQSIDPAVGDILAGMNRTAESRALPLADRKRQAQEKARDKRRNRLNLDLPADIETELTRIARELRCPISQVAAAALLVGLSGFDRIEWHCLLVPTRSPKFENSIDLGKLREMIVKGTLSHCARGPLDKIQRSP